MIRNGFKTAVGEKDKWFVIFIKLFQARRRDQLLSLEQVSCSHTRTGLRRRWERKRVVVSVQRQRGTAQQGVSGAGINEAHQAVSVPGPTYHLLLLHRGLTQWQGLLFSLMLLIRYKHAPQLYFPVRSQQELQRNADSAGKSVSHSAAATGAERETGHRPLQKAAHPGLFASF